MLVASYTTVRPEMGRTRTYEDWRKMLGEPIFAKASSNVSNN